MILVNSVFSTFIRSIPGKGGIGPARHWPKSTLATAFATPNGMWTNASVALPAPPARAFGNGH